MLIVKDKDTVKVHYTGRFINGEIFDSSEGREPLEFTLGQGMLIPGFEKAVIGMMANQSKTVTIPVEEAYGPVMEEMVQQVPREALPPRYGTSCGHAVNVATTQWYRNSLSNNRIKRNGNYS